ncbi:hypothetical protein DFH08DRAFT_714721 [Mycena albidolilacea]|uniref:Uncharacterized protein n=1 Tax=Mycena albidolilacea TaxID=1033008 RepID=A0AAD6ZD29_9AGAR|nr:hypothetical protein DFH08DRAFT_714721 [Mycena albidolilacea]
MDCYTPSSPRFVFSSDEEDESSSQDGNCDTSEDESDSPELQDDGHAVDVDKINADPLYRSRASIFEASESMAEEDNIPSAFDDHPAIWNAYIRIFVGAAFDGMTREAVKLILAGYEIAFKASSSNINGLSDFARTLPTVEKRLGVCTDSLITYYFLCTGCWKPHTRQELAQLESPNCIEPDCSGILYTLKRLSDGEKRTPALTLPFAPPEKALQRMALQAGKVAQWQKWRGPEDIPGVREPVTLKGYAAFSDLDKPMTDITDGWGWRAVQAGLERRRNGKWEIKDVDVHELKLQFVALPNGLILQINIDWFQAVKAGCHSTGAMYGTICNNPRGIRHLREETFLITMFPGPHEPTQEQFNNVMNICVKHFQKLYNGIYLKVSGEPEPDLFHVQIGTDVSDLPASRKTRGLLAVTSKWFMCDHCDTPFFALVDRDAFDSTKINERDPWRYIKYAFRARDASPEIAEEISRRRGVRWSAMDNLVNWLPGVTNLFDLMHAIFLGIIKHLFREILQKNGMIDNEATKKLEDFLSRLIWPVSVSRMPPSVSIARGSGSIKADQWRSLITVLFVGLFFAWQVDGEIPNVDAPPSAENTKNAAAQRRQEKLVRSRMKENYLAKNPNPSEAELERIKTVQMNRSLRLHYENLVQFTAGICIITSDTISPNEVKRGCGAVQRSIQSWADMNCHLVSYFHYAAVHLEPQFLKHGPAPGWWTFPYERNNGFLGRFNTNGHSGGELEGTMMRGWWKTTLIQDLIACLEQIPHPTPEDIDSLNVLKSHLKADKGERHGTLQNYIARAQADRNLDKIRYPRYSKNKSLREMEDRLYHLVFRHLQTLWAPDILLIADVEMSHDKTAITFMGEVESFSHIWIHRRRYGAATQQRGIKAQYAYIDSRVPVRIHHIFRIQQNLPDKNKLTTGCAIHGYHKLPLRPLVLSAAWTYLKSPPQFFFRATDIGVRAWDAEVFASREVVSLERLSGQFVLAPVEVCEQALWITIAYDHVRCAFK